MIAAIPSAVLIGVDGHQVSVEVHVSNGLPGFTVVGLPDAAVRESRDRVRAALLSSGLPWPMRRVTVNLAPSGMRKNGAGLDLPIAIGVLVASGELGLEAVASTAFVGELGLDGSLRGVPGTVVLAESLRGFRLVVADESAREASIVGGCEVRTSPTLCGLVDRLSGRSAWRAAPEPSPDADDGGPHSGSHHREGPTGGFPSIDLSDVRGQHLARRALEVAAAGGHHLLMVGPPGSGKTMLATRLPGLLPPLDRSTALETTRVHSVAGLSVATDRLGLAPSVSLTSPRNVAGSDDRWWNRPHATGRDQYVARRRIVPRRVGRVPHCGPRRPPPTARGRPGQSQSSPRIHDFPRPVHPGGFYESLSMWRRRCVWHLPLQRLGP